jgi:hypothetical protein
VLLQLLYLHLVVVQLPPEPHKFLLDCRVQDQMPHLGGKKSKSMMLGGCRGPGVSHRATGQRVGHGGRKSGGWGVGRGCLTTQQGLLTANKHQPTPAAQPGPGPGPGQPTGCLHCYTLHIVMSCRCCPTSGTASCCRWRG